MEFHGLQKMTLLDYPGKVACTVFTPGCNFLCPFCHNASLVTKINKDSIFTEEEILQFLSKRKGLLDGIAITGGEPLLHDETIDFITKVKKSGFLVKLDTNGSFPEKLKKVIEIGDVDYIAMDIKNSLEKYSSTIGKSGYEEKIGESIDIIMKSGIDYEFRTTVCDELHTEDDIAKIAKRIKNAKGYFIQKFVDSSDLVGSAKFSAPSDEKLQKMLGSAKVYVPNTFLRGIE